MPSRSFRFLIIAVLIFFVPTWGAQVLFPISQSAPLPGAHGSLWVTEIVVHNPTGDWVEIVACPGILQMFNPRIPPGVSREFFPIMSPTPAIFACFNGDLRWQARVKDLSRQSQTWGTELPVIRQTDLREVVILVGVPTDERFRQTLRVYNWRVGDNASYQVEVLTTEGNAVLSFPLETVRLSALSEPGYAQMVDLVTRFPELAAFESVTLRITATSPDIRLWAFVSVTNNETQHVTLITPDQAPVD